MDQTAIQSGFDTLVIQRASEMDQECGTLFPQGLGRLCVLICGHGRFENRWRQDQCETSFYQRQRRGCAAAFGAPQADPAYPRNYACHGDFMDHNSLDRWRGSAC